MVRISFVVLTLFFSTLIVAQDNSDAIEAAKLGIIEKLYERGADRYRANLVDRGLSEAEVESLLFDAFDAYALCTALAAQAQAHEQGLAVDIILKGFGSRTRGQEASFVLMALDTEALKLKTAPCNQSLADKLDVIVR